MIKPDKCLQSSIRPPLACIRACDDLRQSPGRTAGLRRGAFFPASLYIGCGRRSMPRRIVQTALPSYSRGEALF
jgi:hypothetical protein